MAKVDGPKSRMLFASGTCRKLMMGQFVVVFWLMKRTNESCSVLSVYSTTAKSFFAFYWPRTNTRNGLEIRHSTCGEYRSD